MLKAVKYTDEKRAPDTQLNRQSKMLRHLIGRAEARYAVGLSRSIKTLHTPVFKTNDLTVRQALLEDIKLLDRIVNSASQNKSILSTGKYRTKPQIITSQDTIKLQAVVREFLDRLQLEQSTIDPTRWDFRQKLGKIGLQLFVDCHDMNIIPMSTTLSHVLAEQYNQSPTRQTLEGILQSLSRVRNFLEGEKVVVEDKDGIDALVDQLCHSREDLDILKRVLEALDYKLLSPDAVRVVKGRRTSDELDVSKGWRFATGILDTNEAYLRSLSLPEKKLISIDKETLVLVYDGTLKDANTILPSLNHAAKTQKSLLLLVNGDCIGDALTCITINNNKNMRQGNDTRTIILKYNARANDGLMLQENFDLIKFLNLPRGMESIYSPDFSACVPSKVSADQFYGTVDSLKATTGETFLYNSAAWSDEDSQNKSLQMTVTIKVGGHSELEIDQRRNFLDNLINNVLCHGLSSGFVPTYGVALAKAVGPVNDLAKHETSLETKLGIEAVSVALTAPMTSALENVYGYNKFQASTLVADTIRGAHFFKAPLGLKAEEKDLLNAGLLEPWDKIDKCFANVATFIKLLSSCNTVIAQVNEKPQRARE